jgi:predicted ArsR family transcriptional regulator
MRLGALGRRLGITPSTLTRNVARLEAAGFVTREDDPEDARSARVGLTPAGRAAAEAVEQQELAFAGKVVERLPEDRREALRTAFRDLLLAVREATEECCPGAFEHLMEGLPRARAVGDAAGAGRCRTIVGDGTNQGGCGGQC